MIFLGPMSPHRQTRIARMIPIRMSRPFRLRRFYQISLRKRLSPQHYTQPAKVTPNAMFRILVDDRAPRTYEVLDNAIRLGLPSSIEVFIKYGSDPDHCRFDGGAELHAFVLRFYATASHDESSDKRILHLLLDQIDSLARDQNGETVVGTLFHLGAMQIRAKMVTEKLVLRTRTLAELFLECLPEHKVLEKKVLTSMMNVSSEEIKNLVSKHHSGTVGQ